MGTGVEHHLGVVAVGRDQRPHVGGGVDGDVQQGRTIELKARAVIDATGTWNTPNPVGASGLPAIGEPGLADSPPAPVFIHVFLPRYSLNKPLSSLPETELDSTAAKTVMRSKPLQACCWKRLGGSFVMPMKTCRRTRGG